MQAHSHTHTNSNRLSKPTFSALPILFPLTPLFQPRPFSKPPSPSDALLTPDPSLATSLEYSARFSYSHSTATPQHVCSNGFMRLLLSSLFLLQCVVYRVTGLIFLQPPLLSEHTLLKAFLCPHYLSLQPNFFHTLDATPYDFYLIPGSPKFAKSLSTPNWPFEHFNNS